MITVLFEPDRFYHELPRDAPGIPALIVLISGLVNTLGTAFLIAASWSTITSAGPFVTSTYLLGLVYKVGGGFVTWLLYAGAFHLISLAFGGDGEFRTVVAYVGWGFIPIILAGLGNAIVIGYVTWETRFPSDPTQLGPFVHQLTDGSLFATLELVGLALSLWSGLLWIFGVKHARNVSTRQATLTVAIPLSIGVLWNLGGIS
ncbi:MAG: YIP1 family protein [Halanaeroarchaeum sp.]